MRSPLREILYRHLEPTAWGRSGISPANQIVAWLILIAVGLAILNTEPAINSRFDALISGAELIIFTVFSLEYIARVYAAGEDPQFRGVLGRLKYMRTIWAVIDLVALLPFILTLGSTNPAILRLLRLLRILRIAKLGRLTTAWDVIAESVFSRRFELLLTSCFAALVVVISSSLLYVVEADAQPDTFGSIPRALWWSIATLTTVGYGDVTPLTAIGKLFAGITAIAGIGMIAMPTGILAAAFSDVIQKQKARASANVQQLDNKERRDGV